MGEIVIVVPVLGRPERARPLVESVDENTTCDWRLLFVCSEGDTAQIDACRELDAEYGRVELDIVDREWLTVGGDYARKINYGIDTNPEEWIFQGADDLLFHPGWDEELLRIGENAAASVIGTNDLGNPLVRSGRHATHSLIRRSYVEEWGTIDEPGKALHEGYWHCWVDNELIETAKSRRRYFAAKRSIVEHLHHIWHKGTDDRTYRRGQQRFVEDHRLFRERRPLWRR